MVTLCKQALQDQILALVKGRRVAGVAVAWESVKRLSACVIGSVCLPQASSSQAPSPFSWPPLTQVILDFWPQEARKFGLEHLLERIDFTIYHSLSKTLSSGHYHKLDLDECDGSKILTSPS